MTIVVDVYSLYRARKVTTRLIAWEMGPRDVEGFNLAQSRVSGTAFGLGAVKTLKCLLHFFQPDLCLKLKKKKAGIQCQPVH